MKKLGILGGMGPAAGAEFLARFTALTPATRDQEHIPTVLWSNPKVPDRSTSILNRDNLPLPLLIEGIKGLQTAGCNYIVIPCNTAHFWYNDLLKLGTPIIHIVDSVAEALIEVNAVRTTIGILGTKGTIELGLYQRHLRNLGWDCIIPSSKEMDILIQPAINLIKSNQVKKAYDPLIKAIDNLVNQGAKAVVLGCTEIPLAVTDDHYQGVFLINSIDSLAKAAIKVLTK
jgi:aspartate racemase